jgi:mediator of RNA polymerase II transcription subunit 17
MSRSASALQARLACLSTLGTSDATSESELSSLTTTASFRRIQASTYDFPFLVAYEDLKTPGRLPGASPNPKVSSGWFAATMASTPGSHFALRPLPLPQSERKPANLAEFIARVNTDKGGFRNVTEESLRKELEAEANDVVESKEVDMLNGESDVDGDAESQITFEEFHEAFNEVRRNVEYDLLSHTFERQTRPMLTSS